MRSRLLTLIVLAAAAWGLWHWALAADGQQAPMTTEGLLFPHLDRASITSIHMTLDFGYDLELEREPAGPWRITAPTNERARAELVEQWLDNVAQATVRPLEFAGDPLPPQVLGLEPPKHQFTLRDVKGNATTLFLGEVEPLGRYVYARAKGSDSLGLVTRNVVSFTGYHGEEWVDPDLLRGLAGQVTRLRIVKPQGVLIDAELQGGSWRLLEPAGVLPDSDRIDKLVRGLQFARQERTLLSRPSPAQSREFGFPTDEQVAAGDYAGATYIEVHAAGEREIWALLVPGWEAVQELVPARRDDSAKVIGVPAASLNMLRNGPEFFRQHALLPPVRERADSLRLSRGDTLLLDVGQDAQGRWEYRAPERLVGTALENERVLGHTALLDLLGRIDRAEAVAFTSLPEGEPSATIVVGWKLGGAGRQDRVDLFAPLADGPHAGLVPAVTSERPKEALLLEPGILELFAPDVPDRLRSLSPLRVSADELDEFVVHGAAGTPAEADPLRLWRDESGRWQGDDEWGRRFGLAHDLLRGFRGYRWRPTAGAAGYPAELLFRGSDGAVLARVSLREPGPGELSEEYGKPVVLAAIDGIAGLELAVPRTWMERVAALDEPLQREP